jgi:hypothetical protein
VPHCTHCSPPPCRCKSVSWVRPCAKQRLPECRDRASPNAPTAPLYVATPSRCMLRGMLSLRQAPPLPPHTAQTSVRAIFIILCVAMQQADHAAQLDADEAASAVLLSPDLFPELFQFLDRGSKAALRCASRAMCSLVDGSIETVASPLETGFSDISLIATLARCPRVHDLTLLYVGSTSDLASLATTSLAGLKSLTVRQVGMGAWLHAWSWSDCTPIPRTRPSHWTRRSEY